MTRPGVTVQLMGGCANQIFQYATALALAQRLGVELRLDISRYGTPGERRAYVLGLFKEVDAPLVRSLSGQVIREYGLPYTPALLEGARRKCSLVGYWQCEKYFFTLRAELQRRLLPGEPLSPFHSEIERRIAKAGKRSVFLHIRRTDSVGSAYHGLVPMEFYSNAVSLIAAKVVNPIFFVFSDEPDWCRKNLHLSYPMTIADHANHTIGQLDREDAALWLMRQCCHAITANSSFSWWGAWLGADAKGGIVVAPKNWVTPECKDDPRDIVPERWIRK